MQNRITLGVAALVFICGPTVAADKTYEQTSDFRESSRVQNRVCVKNDLHSKMVKGSTLRGTRVDWAWAEPSFDLDDLRGQDVAIYVDLNEDLTEGLPMREANPFVDEFLKSLNGIGLKAHLGDGTMPSAPAPRSSNPRQPDPGQMERVMLEAARRDKNQRKQMLQMAAMMVSSEAIAKENEQWRTEKEAGGGPKANEAHEDRLLLLTIRAMNGTKQPEPAPEVATVQETKPELPKNSRNQGYAIVVYQRTKQKLDRVVGAFHSHWTDAEICLLKDGKPLVAAHHYSTEGVLGYTAARRNAQEIATALSIIPAPVK